MAGEVARELAGSWGLESSDNVDNYLIELGIEKYERKSYTTTNNQTIWVEEDIIHLKLERGTQHFKIEFKLGEEFEIKAGKCSKAVARWENGAMLLECRRTDTGLLQIIERKREGDNMIQTMTTNGVTCRRTMKRVA